MTEHSSPGLVVDDFASLELLYKGLRAHIASGEGSGFHNKDQGHPIYVAGSQGQDSEQWGERPDQNRLYQLLRTLSLRLKQLGADEYNWYYDLSSWEQFCRFARPYWRTHRVLSWTQLRHHFRVNRDQAWALVNAGFTDPEEVKQASDRVLLRVKSIGPHTVARIREDSGPQGRLTA